MKEIIWFLEFPSEMIECGSVVIANMCQAREACECKVNVSETRRVTVVYMYTYEVD